MNVLYFSVLLHVLMLTSANKVFSSPSRTEARGGQFRYFRTEDDAYHRGDEVRTNRTGANRTFGGFVSGKRRPLIIRVSTTKLSKKLGLPIGSKRVIYHYKRKGRLPIKRHRLLRRTIPKPPNSDSMTSLDLTCHCVDRGQCDNTTGLCSPGEKCSGGYWGQTCEKMCHCKHNTLCSQNGTCSIGCKLGWSGDTCQIRACPDGQFTAPDCSKVCHCADQSTCDPVTGRCGMGMCSPGWWGDNCQENSPRCDPRDTNCRPGSVERCYCTDPNCTLPDNECRTGECPRGLTGPKCDQAVCPRNKYGPECKTDCHCLHPHQCDQLTGSCNGSPCQEGWMGRDCQSPACPLKHFGYPDCNQTCFCESANIDEFDNPATTGCDDTGNCSLGCKNGWKGSHCNQRFCPPGKWGPQLKGNEMKCRKVCRCDEEEFCNSYTGECELGGCLQGWFGFYCQEQTSLAKDEELETRGNIVHVVLGGLLVLIASAVAIFVAVTMLKPGYRNWQAGREKWGPFAERGEASRGGEAHELY